MSQNLTLTNTKCRCGCGQDGRWLMTGQDYDGAWFTDEPACDAAAMYCEGAAADLGLPFTKRPLVA